MKSILLGAVGFVSAIAAPAAHAAVFPIGSPNFFITNGTPFTPSITATFFNSYSTTTPSFDDFYTFTIPQNGTGSGSISTSFSSNLNKLTFTDLIINGISYASSFVTTSGGQSLSVGGVKIVANQLNTIEVRGFTVGQGGYSGTATFSAAVPEAGTWLMMVGGFGCMGAAMRRRRTTVTFA